MTTRKEIAEAKDIMAASAPEAARRVVQLMRASNEIVAIKAAELILAHAYGRPPLDTSSEALPDSRDEELSKCAVEAVRKALEAQQKH